MRVAVVIGVVVVAFFVLVLSTGAISTVITQDQAADAVAVDNVSCNAAIGPTSTDPALNGNRDAANLNTEQRNIVGMIIAIGKQRKLAPRAWQVAIQAGMTESGLRNLNYGDRDSLGIFQMRPSMNWGSVAEITNPVYAINKFYDVLLTVSGWEQQRPGDSAQAVERSAFPSRYHRWEAMAAFLIGNLGNIANWTGCGQGTGNLLPASQAAGLAIKFALAQQGKPYQWGAATNQQNSYDCSSLMLQAYRAAGITIPRVAADQYNAGAKLPVRDAKPGDLVFWAYDLRNPDTIHHVAMYLGDNKILEAQQDGVPVHIRPLRFTEGELVQIAVRPGV